MSALLICAILLAGCDRRETIETYSVSKTLPIGSNDAADPAADSSSPIHWTVPEGWKSLPGHDLRFASFAVSPDDPSAQLTVVPLGAEAGSLVENVNRWEKQLGLPLTAQGDLDKVITMTDIAGVSAGMLDLTGPLPTDGKARRRMLAAVIPRPDRTWFFKLAGSDALVAAQKDKFNAFIQSIRFDTDVAQPAQAVDSPQPPATQPAPLVFTAPDDWVQQPASNQFRVVAFQIPSNNQTAEVVVSKLPANSGSVLDNVNRWRGQVNLDAVADLSQAPSQQMKIDGLDADVWDLQGPAPAAGQPAARIVVAMVTRGSVWWFFKMQGPADLVGTQQGAFMSFLASIRFQGDAQ